MLSKTAKLDGIYSWSLTAGADCPGKINLKTNTLAEVCAGCYAIGGNYRYPNVQAVRIQNREEWQQDDWEDQMVSALENQTHFRWFDSGDAYSLTLAWKIYRVMVRTPDTKHWLATRMGKFSKFAPVLSEMQALPNVMVRFSADDIGKYGPEHTAMVWHDTVPEGVTPCSSYVAEGDKVAKCHGCRACWDKSVPVIGYKAHGRKMIKLLEV